MILITGKKKQFKLHKCLVDEAFVCLESDERSFIFCLKAFGLAQCVRYMKVCDVVSQSVSLFFTIEVLNSIGMKFGKVYIFRGWDTE